MNCEMKLNLVDPNTVLMYFSTQLKKVGISI